MATYPGMTLSGEIRESISLDEDDLSDVEDEVFIRDGKNSYKLAEELNVKRPLMAPRRKFPKNDLTSRIKAKPPCRAFCKPCCYIFTALSILIGIIILVVILVSIFPLPLDKLRDWLISKSKPSKAIGKLLPCSSLKITELWTTNLPILTTDSPIRLLDLDNDGTDDILFGFGTGDNYNIISSSLFCPIFLGVPPPCEGGVIAINGTNGDIIWRYWTNDTIFFLQCSSDLNGDGFKDCLATGTSGTLIALDSKNGTIIWYQQSNKFEIFLPNFIPDVNNDTIDDIITSHTSLSRKKEGHLVVISGKTGRELKRIEIPNQTETFFMPQLLNTNGSWFIVFGTGNPLTPGNLSLTPLDGLITGNMSEVRTLYQDQYKGVLIQSVLVDLNNDNISDIVTAMSNSTVFAFDGLTLQQLWNFSIPNSESNITPTPAYFNDDNITDFLIIYEKYDNILNYNYTSAFIIDGKNGKPIYSKAISGSVATQMNGLTLSMEGHGFDMFLFWTAECLNDKKNNVVSTDICRQFNSTTVLKLNSLNQYDQPPGFEVYNSAKRSYFDVKNTKSAFRQIKEYLTLHGDLSIIKTPGQLEVDENYLDNTEKLRINKYGNSNFRHKDVYQPENEETSNNDETFDNVDYDTVDNGNLFNSYDSESSYTNRDPRSKKETPEKPKYGIYDYQNIKMSRNRLLNDLNNIPYDILRDTYYKNRENQLRKSKFEQRDITSHIDKIKQNEEVKRLIENEKTKENTSFTLWDLESEKELQDKENGYWRGKRSVNSTLKAVQKVTSVGAVLKPKESNGNVIDVIFATYWIPYKISPMDAIQTEIDSCVTEKLANDQAHLYTKNTAKEQKDLYINECRTEQENLKDRLDYYNQIYQLNLGQMTVFRIRIECLCDLKKDGERCANFLTQNKQAWPMYLGKFGTGLFLTRN